MLYRHPQYQKPPAGIRIDWQHPLARGLVGCWLLNESSGNPRNLVNGSDWLTLTGSAAWGQVADGPSVQCVGTSLSGMALSATSAMKPANNITLIWRGVVLGTGVYNGNAKLAEITYDNADGSPYASYGIIRAASGANNIALEWNSAGSYASLALANQIVFGEMASFGATFASGAGGVAAYKNGVLLNTATGPSSIDYGATATLLIGRHISDNNQNTNSAASLVAIYNRVLSATEMVWLHGTPYAMIVSDPLRRYWILYKAPAGGGGSVTLEGRSDGTSIATGALSSTKPVTGTSAGTSGATGSLQSADALSAATSNGTSDATADLSVSSPGAVPLAGQADGEATATGALINSKPVAGTSAGTSAVTGALSNTKPLAATSDGTSGATGSVATDKSMGGSAAGLGGLTASLQTALALAGSIAGASSVVGAIGVPIAIVGTADGVGGATGALSVSALQITELGSAMAGGNKLMSTGSLMRSVR